MFGESIIVGKTVSRMDYKGRIFIPSFTNVESGDKLIYEVKDNSIKFFLYSKYMEIIDRYKKLIENSSSYEEMLKYQKDLEDVCINLGNTIVDAHSRIIIPALIRNDLEWEAPGDYLFNGLGDSLLLTKKTK